MTRDIEDMLGRLDLPAKVRLLSGAGAWTLQEEPAIGLRTLTVSDGPVGVRGGSDTELDPSAALPSGSGMAASWDEDLLHRIGTTLAGEAVRKGVDVVLGPTVNLHRSPLGGRHFECLSEDPLLSGRLAAAYTRGVQERGIGACPKHYVANDAETDRMSVDNRVDERTLRELYLAPFETVVRDAAPWMVMAAYNGVNGAPMTENDLLAEPLKGEWGFAGVVVSDWHAVYSTAASARSALDLAMPGPEPRWGEPLVEAVRAGLVPESAIDEKLRRILALAARAGKLGEAGTPAVTAAAGSIADAAPIAREAAAAGTVLLTNHGTLPLRAAELTRVAVVGPGARDPRALGGGSASVPLPYVVTPVAGLARALEGRAEVVSAVGAALSDSLRPVRADELTGSGHAAVIRWLDADGGVVEERGVGTAVLVRLATDVPEGAVELELVTRFVPDVAGDWRVGVTGFGTAELFLDGERAAGGTRLQEGFDIGEIFSGGPQYSATVPLRGGEGVDVRLRYRWPEGAPLFRAGLVVGLPLGPADDELAAAVELARTSDVAVVVVGTSDEVESEGFDRTSLALPGRQEELVRAVAAVNPRTVVVVNAGAPVELPWRDEVAAVLVSWFPGMEFGNALADVLLGEAEPGGRLPTTWPAATADAPVLTTTPTDGVLEYAEGLHIGFRAYLRAGVQPAFWFGHGLGYTGWAYESVEAPAWGSGEGVVATVRVRNTGERAGREVVQVYAARPDSAVERPARWLAGFAVVAAGPGEVVEVPVRIGSEAFRHWDAEAHTWAVEPGEVVLSAGRSAGDPRVHASITLRVAGTQA